jgi:hypothetical protein
MLLIYSNPQSWGALSEAEREALTRGHEEITAELRRDGRLVSGAGLLGPEQTRTVKVRDDELMTTDGPYVEAKEHLAGYYLVECADIDEAMAIAGQLPDAKINAVEVRPVNEASPHD